MPFILINEFAKPFITDNYIYDESFLRTDIRVLIPRGAQV